MRDHGKLSPQFWIGETGRKFRGDAIAQVVALYLISSPHATMIGLYYLPLYLISHETGHPVDAIRGALRKIEAAGFARYDEESEHIWIPQMARHQIGSHLKPGDKRVGWVRDLYEQVAKRPFADDLMALYGGAYHLSDVAPSKPHRRDLGRGIEGASKGHPGSSGGDGDRDGDRDIHQPLPGAFGVSDETSRDRTPELSGPKPPDDPTRSARAGDLAADDPDVALLAAWNSRRQAMGYPAEPLTDRHRATFGELLAAVESDRALALATIEAFLGWQDPWLKSAHWTIATFSARISGAVLMARERLARERRSNRAAQVAAEPAEAPLPAAEARERLAALPWKRGAKSEEEVAAENARRALAAETVRAEVRGG